MRGLSAIAESLDNKVPIDPWYTVTVIADAMPYFYFVILIACCLFPKVKPLIFRSYFTCAVMQ